MDKFIPKNGDFCYFNNGYCERIVIYDRISIGMSHIHVYAKCDLRGNNLVLDDLLDDKCIRLATLEEKIIMTSTLAKDDKYWDAVNKSIKPLKNKNIVEEKSIKIDPPEGYEIDKENSTFEKIKFKKINKVNKFWEWLLRQEEPFSGYYVSPYNEVKFLQSPAIPKNMQLGENAFKSIFKKYKQASSSLAYAQLSQLMADSEYNGNWEPDWNDGEKNKYCIERIKDDLVVGSFIHTHHFLAFKDIHSRDKFLKEYEELIKQFFGI